MVLDTSALLAIFLAVQLFSLVRPRSRAKPYSRKTDIVFAVIILAGGVALAIQPLHTVFR